MAGRIYDRLVAHHGSESIFMDVDNVPYGANFREHIQAVFRSTEVLVAVIGHQWLGHQAQGTSRIHDKNDPVRIEIQTALQEQVLVIPVLIDGAKCRIPTSFHQTSGISPIAMLFTWIRAQISIFM